MLGSIWAIWVISAIDGIIESRLNIIRSGLNDPYRQYLFTKAWVVSKHGLRKVISTVDRVVRLKKHASAEPHLRF